VLLPPHPGRPAPAHLVEIGCGEGLLARVLLGAFPQAVVHGYDGSHAMLERARQNLHMFGERFDARPFELADGAWRRFVWPVQAVVSSLVIHHLDGWRKRALFSDLAGALEPGGVLLIADLVLPATRLGSRLAAVAWDEAVRERSNRLAGGPAAYEQFQAMRWNYYADPQDCPSDRPSPLYDQLRWLEEAGFAGVDVFWMRAGHALFGGTKPAPAGARLQLSPRPE
jgi:tRNA (cmo5U34)-methyltransferase